MEYIFYPEKRDKIYESFELLFQGLNSKDAEEIFGVLIRYLLSATDEKPENAEEKVKHLPKGGETVRTTAQKLREEGFGEDFGEGLFEAVELGVSIKFGDTEESRAFIEKIKNIKNVELLKALKDSIKTAETPSDLIRIIDN